MCRGEGLGNLLVLREILITYAAFHPGKSPQAYWHCQKKMGPVHVTKQSPLCTIWFRGQLCPRNERLVQPIPGGPRLWGGHLLEFLLLHGEILQRLQGWRFTQKNRWGFWEQIHICAFQLPLVVKLGTIQSPKAAVKMYVKVYGVYNTL